LAELSQFEGHEVTEVGVEMPNAAGGLQAAMKFDPVELEIADEGYVVLHYQVKKVRHEPIEKDDFEGPLRRVHVLSVNEAALVDDELVADHMASQRERIKKAQDEAKGTMSLDLDGDDNENLPLGDSDEDLKQKEVEALIAEGHSDEEARRQVYGDAA
jgi:hypothetical protein